MIVSLSERSTSTLILPSTKTKWKSTILKESLSKIKENFSKLPEKSESASSTPATELEPEPN